MKNTALATLALISLLAGAAHGQTVNPPLGPKTWIDKDTGHRVERLSEEPGSSSNYFNVNSFTPDGRWMAISTPSGIATIDLKTHALKVVVPGGRLMFVGKKTGLIYFTKFDRPAGPPPAAGTPRGPRGPQSIQALDLTTGQTHVVLTGDNIGGIQTINADETLFAGSSEVRDPTAPRTPAPPQPTAWPDGKPFTYAEQKEVMLNTRLEQKVPMELFTIDIKTGARKVITASTDWLGHVQFSPADPKMLMYCHEGPWHKVDRVWLVDVSAASPQPVNIHKRTQNMEIAGHEWFSADGKTVWYDLQTPRGEDFWVAGFEIATGKRTWYHLQRNEWSVHFNSSPDGKVFSGDGGDPEMVAHAPDGKYLYIFTPSLIPDVAGLHADNAGALITPGVLNSEKLVNMQGQNYKTEPNATFTPDGKWLVFRGNFEGASQVYAVEIAKPKP